MELFPHDLTTVREERNNELSSLHSHMTSLPYREVDRALMELSAFQHDLTTVRKERNNGTVPT